MTHAGVGTTTNLPLIRAISLQAICHHRAPSQNLGNSHPVVARSNSKAAHLIWMNSGAISTANSVSCLAARAVLKNHKALVAQVAALAAPVFLFS